MTSDWTPAELERLETILRHRSGLAFGEARRPFLRNRAREAMARAGFTSIARWLAEVGLSAEKRGVLYRDLEEALQDHETAFFRYEAHHRALREHVLPPLLKRGGLRVRVASIGCATGEEAYSIAMTVRECGPLAAGMVEIVALDLSRPTLAQAVAGTYPRGRLEPVSLEYRARFFLAAGGDRVTVIPALRRMVRFRQLDVRRGLYLGKFDVIVCSNVLLSFTPAVQAQVIGDLADSLIDGGYLFLGEGEGVPVPSWAFGTDELLAPSVYRRVGGRPAIAAPSHG
jgi:chemotaxis protein methyltransferase CheR